jgi:DNA-binding MarR family transcriptional regulator
MFVMSVQRALEELIQNYERCEQMCATQYGVTVAQSYALLALPREGTVTMNDLSQSMGLANSTMTRMVDQLVAKGHVVRDADPGDRRVVLVSLTSRGSEVQNSLEETQEEFLQNVLANVGEKERQTIIPTLQMVSSALVKAKDICFSE